MRLLLSKAKSAIGETLVETLAAVLICGLAATVLMSSVGVAGTLNFDARQQTREIQAEDRFASQFNGYYDRDKASGSNPTHIDGEVVFSDKGDSSKSTTVSEGVEVYGGSLVMSYDIENATW